jgi:CheY-like chemotaxis protein/PAS domain-containing protein
MRSLSTRLLLGAGLLAGAGLGAHTWLALGRVEVSVAAARGQRIQLALLESRPLLESGYAAEGAPGLRRALARLARAAEADLAAIADRSGRVVAASAHALEGRPLRSTALAPAARLAAAAGSHARIGAEGGALYAALPLRLEPAPPDPSRVGPPRVPVGPAHVLIRHDPSAALGAARGAVLSDASLLAGGLLAGLLLLALGLQLGLARPARRILSTLERFDRGELEARTGLRGTTEVARIGGALDGVAERLQLREADLVELNARLDTVLESLPAGVMVIRRDDGRPLYVNTRWMDLCGIPMDSSRDILSLLSAVRWERSDGSSIPLEQLPIPTVLRTGVATELPDLWVRRDEARMPLVAGAVPIKLWSADVFDAVVGVVQAPGVSLAADDRAAAALAPSLAGGSPPPGAERRAPPGGAPVPASRPARQERPTVLVVEGEAALRELTEQALADAGYRVVVTGSGEEAISLFSVESRAVSAVVLDLWVPSPGGRMLAEELVEIDPSARLIGASGYRSDLPELSARGLLAAFLPKPYGAERLLATVRGVLARPPAEAAAR